MTSKEYFSVLIPSLALCIALYTFLSNNSKFREFGKKFWPVVMLQLCSVLLCSLLLIIEGVAGNIDVQFNNIDKIKAIIDKAENIITFSILGFFLCSWIALLKIFFNIYGCLYHLRKKRFVKYMKPVSWFYEKFIHRSFYENNFRGRSNLTSNSFSGIDPPQNILENLKKGGTILVLYSDTSDYTSFIVNYIQEAINSHDNETVDYICTYKTPIAICKSIPEPEYPKISKHLSIIDCFSDHYSFDDKVIKHLKREYTSKGFRFFDAYAFSEIHSASNDSWYRFRKNCVSEESEYRIPHRTIYDTLSSLVRFSSEEMYFTYLRHVISSEKSYGMITMIIEPDTLEGSIKNDLIRTSDIVLKFDNNKFTICKS